MSQKIKAVWKSGVHMVSEGPGGQVAMDGSPEIGGQEKGVRPKAMMLSALAGCAGVDIAMLFEKMRIKVAGFDIEVSGILTENHPKYYEKVTVVFNFYGVDFPKEKIERAVELSTETYCGVMAMFRKFATVDVKIAYHENA